MAGVTVMIERIQKRAARLVSNLRDLKYTERLKELSLGLIVKL